MAGVVEDLSHSLECVKIGAPWTAVENPEVAVDTDIPPILGQHHHLSPVSVSFPIVSSSEVYGGSTNFYYPGNEYPELAFVTAPDSFISGGGDIYIGSPAPALDVNGHVPYPVEGVYYQNMAVDSYLNQPVYSTVAEYPITEGNDVCVYGAQMQQYPLQPYHQHGHVGQYVAGLSSNSMMIETRDPSLVMPNGYAGFDEYMRCPFVIEQPEAEAFPVTVTYSSRPLRASAPAWVEPSKEKLVLKEIVPVTTHLAPKLNPAMRFPPLYQFSGVLAKNDSSVAVKNKDVLVAKTGVSEKLDASTGSNIKESTTRVCNKVAFNSPDFITKYDDAKFFIIKSYNDDNVIKSIQFKVWASTPNGNKKLDDAYRDAQRRGAGKHGGCPVFLFFSVNGSRQFCGVAEMTSAVDYRRTMEFWEQNRWSGSFQVKWRIVKNVPNTQFRGIILQNNENKPVTNSRDTQEVLLHQGLEMLEIFRGYPLRGCILDLCPMDGARLGGVKTRPQRFPKFVEASIRKQPVDNGLKMTTKLNFVDNTPKITELNAKLVGQNPESGGNGADVGKDKRLDKENIEMESLGVN